eukprot:TRINITY_DN38357_c0_g1_i1.p1 TRINITY_DN38357_c0_g1~~TRINITY_DN38357_c0_g1_i1.p1  ORF type:complete len:255 (+),score=35.45 TRINITY_DN38357_c0_g1_i1:58-765(+)
MAEVRIGNSTVSVDLAAEFAGDQGVAAQVARFKPFISWAGDMKVPSHVSVKGIEVVSVDQMVGRICGVRLSMLLESRAGEISRHTVTLSDEEQAALLVVVAVEETEFVIVTQTGHPAIPESAHVEIPSGTVGACFESPASELLKKADIGLVLNDFAQLTTGKDTQALSLGEPGSHPVRFYHTKIRKDQAYREQFPLTDGKVVVDLVPIDSLRGSTSTRTVLALGLYKSLLNEDRN